MAAARNRVGTRQMRKAGPLALAGFCLLLLLSIVSSHGGGAASACADSDKNSLPDGPAAPALQGNRAPFHLCFAPDGRRLYVTESAETTVAVIDPAAGRVLTRFDAGGQQPAGLTVSGDGRLLAVANSGSDSVVV